MVLVVSENGGSVLAYYTEVEKQASFETGYVVPESLSIKLDSQHSEYKWFDIKSQDIHSYIQHRIELIFSNNCFFYDPRINLPIFGK